MTALATLRQTLRLLISIDRRSVLLSFVAGAGSAAITGVVFWIARAVLRSFGEDQRLSVTFGVVLAVVLLAQIVFQGTRSLAGTLLRQRVVYRINTEILGRLRSVPYKDFEDNRFQSEYGLVVWQAALRPGELVDIIVRTTQSALTVLVLLASMMYLSWPISLGFMLLIGPVIWVERRLGSRLLDLQTSSSPEVLRMQYLSQMSIDAQWQRDLRVHDSDVIETEYERLANRYFDRLVASGGQWQRLALARLLYGDSPLIILDEPATHLDAAGEAQLLERLIGLSSDRIVLIVTHRGETIQTCDRVVELSDGQMVGEGAVPAVDWFATRGGRAFLSPAGHSAPAPRDRTDGSTS